MGQDYDKIFKGNIEELIWPLARKVLDLPEPEGLIEIADSVQRTIERAPDFLKIVTDRQGRPLHILQIEFQTANDPKMVYRMLEYVGLLIRRYELPVKQYVLYIGDGAARMQSELSIGNVNFKFYIRSLIDIPYAEFLATDRPEELILAILGNRQGVEPEVIIDGILSRLRQVVNTMSELEKFLRQLEVLSKLRNLQSITIERIEAMPISYDIETDIRFLQGEQKGILKGVKDGFKDGFKEGRQEAKRDAVQGLLTLGTLTTEQIAKALDVPVAFVLDIQAGSAHRQTE